ncbi:uncharacterized protein LOC125532006 isoform X2 [Triticum urartu]|uniref:uncharacterized protein LOC125532006 isoform X1 n=1 Tax=Triticum urartu TaxID=4572 RepID=UPI00204301CF|nr:uncharacterized protein LOC125532006 isoform X1 [Triticum urartu]XP_048552146.1 uncharacterized protein LOC125532006 isoform X2 [Triticum urartu]
MSAVADTGGTCRLSYFTGSGSYRLEIHHSSMLLDSCGWTPQNFFFSVTVGRRHGRRRRPATPPLDPPSPAGHGDHHAYKYKSPHGPMRSSETGSSPSSPVSSRTLHQPDPVGVGVTCSGEVPRSRPPQARPRAAVLAVGGYVQHGHHGGAPRTVVAGSGDSKPDRHWI